MVNVGKPSSPIASMKRELQIKRCGNQINARRILYSMESIAFLNFHGNAPFVKFSKKGKKTASFPIPCKIETARFLLQEDWNLAQCQNLFGFIGKPSYSFSDNGRKYSKKERASQFSFLPYNIIYILQLHWYQKQHTHQMQTDILMLYMHTT